MDKRLLSNQPFWTRIGAVGAAVWAGITILVSLGSRDFEFFNYRGEADNAFWFALVGAAVVFGISVSVPWIWNVSQTDKIEPLRESNWRDRVTDLPDAEFIALAAKPMENLPADAAMVVVALENLKPILAAMLEAARKDPQAGLPSSLEDFIGFIGKQMNEAKSEIDERRYGWFYFAALVLRATKLAEADRAHEAAIVRIWTQMANGAGYLHTLLPKNVVWKVKEKVWFSHIDDELEGLKYVIVHMMPEWLQRNSEIREFARRHDFAFLLPRVARAS